MYDNPFFKKIRNLNSKIQKKKNKPYSQEISPLNYSFEFNKNKDQIINNYNVKVNITKKKTKNISIGNITLGNNSDKNILNIVSKESNLKNISPLHLDIEKISYNSKKQKKKENGKFRSELDSPHKSFNKIILNLKNEFEEIKNRNYSNSKKKQKEKKKNHSLNHLSNLNKTMTKYHSLNNSKANFQRKKINSSSLEKLRRIGEKNKKTMEIHRIKNFIFKPFSKKNLQKLNFKTEPKADEKSIKSCFINQINLDKDDKSSLYFAKSSIYSFRQSPTISLSYTINNNDKYKKEMLIEDLYNEIKEYKFLVPLLIKYIKIQKKIFMENSYKKNVEFCKKEYLYEIDLLKKTNEYLIEQNNKYKQIILNMMFFIEKYYSSSIINQNKISEKISQIIKENEYLREICKSTLIINIYKEFFTTNSSLTTLKNSFDNSTSLMKRVQINELNDDIFSKLLMKQNLELTIKKQEKKRDKSLIRKKYEYNYPKKKKTLDKLRKKKPLKLNYIKRKNSK